MTFEDITQLFNLLEENLETAANRSAIEREILKKRICDLYLQLIDAKTTPDASVFLAPAQEEPPAAVFEPPIDPFPQTEPAFVDDFQPVEENKMEEDLDYKNLTDILLNKTPQTKTDNKEDKTVLGRFSNAKITDLKRAIAMNERFIFIKELFKNDFEAYNRCINDLNTAAGMEEASSYLAQLKRQYDWDDENEFVCRFISLIERKFI